MMVSSHFKFCFTFLSSEYGGREPHIFIGHFPQCTAAELLENAGKPEEKPGKLVCVWVWVKVTVEGPAVCLSLTVAESQLLISLPVDRGQPLPPEQLWAQSSITETLGCS